MPFYLSTEVFSFAKFVILIVILAIFASVRFHVASKILVTFAIFVTFADFSRAFFAFVLPFKSFLLLNLLFLRYLLACVFTLQVKFLLLLRFLRHLRTSRGPSLPFYLSSLFFC